LISLPPGGADERRDAESFRVSRTGFDDNQRNCTMLVLTRKLMEKLYIGDDVCVTIVRIEGGQVRLGIEAPREVPVVRAELVSESGFEEPVMVHPSPAALAPTAADLRGQIRIRPTAAHGTDSRLRGRSR
jgi:carbon storage regulator